jgi:hypothetical protein
MVNRPDDAALPIAGLYMHSAAIGGAVKLPADTARTL